MNYDPSNKITYGSTEPSDHGLFYGIDEYVNDLYSGKLAGKYSPLQSALWLENMAAETCQHLNSADGKAKGKTRESAEYLAMRVDLSMLCDFANYHAAKIRAAYALAVWNKKNKKSSLIDALLLLDSSIKHWKALAEKGKENYYHDLDFSSAGTPTRRGTWGDLTKELLADRKSIISMLESLKIGKQIQFSESYLPDPLPVENYQMAANFPDIAKANEALTITVNFNSFGESDVLPALHYRHTNQNEGLFHTIKMKRITGGYTATIPARYMASEWDLLIYITIQGSGGSCVMYPGIYHPVYPYPYHVIEVK